MTAAKDQAYRATSFAVIPAGTFYENGLSESWCPQSLTALYRFARHFEATTISYTEVDDFSPNTVVVLIKRAECGPRYAANR